MATDAAVIEQGTIRLQVAAARQEESGRGVARLPRTAFQALGITDALDGRPHGRRSGAWVVDDGGGSADHVACPRIGISRAVDWPLRFVAAGTRYASRPVPRQGR